MRQLALDIRPAAQPSFESFAAGENAELIGRLRALASPRTIDALFLWGAPGSGRSHLLAATAHATEAGERRVTFRAGDEVGAELPLPAGGLLVVDDVERLSPEGQAALFRAFNTARWIGLSIVLSGAAPPRELGLREDLRTRIGQMLVFEVKALGDADAARILAERARAHGLKPDPAVIDYLMRHARRDLSSLLAVLEAADRLSLELKRPVTIPLIREVLQTALPLEE